VIDLSPSVARAEINLRQSGTRIEVEFHLDLLSNVGKQHLARIVWFVDKVSAFRQDRPRLPGVVPVAVETAWTIGDADLGAENEGGDLIKCHGAESEGGHRIRCWTRRIPLPSAPAVGV